MKYLAICFLCIFTYRLATNISNLIRINVYRKKYNQYLANQDPDFAENIIPIVHLFKIAGLSDITIPCVRPVGYGKLFEGHASLYKNLNVIQDDIVPGVLLCFSEAVGVFKHRIRETFSPLFWIQCVIFLPQKALAYVGVNGDSVIVKIMQLLYWLATPCLLIFRDNISQYILSLLS